MKNRGYRWLESGGSFAEEGTPRTPKCALGRVDGIGKDKHSRETLRESGDHCLPHRNDLGEDTSGEGYLQGSLVCFFHCDFFGDDGDLVGEKFTTLAKKVRAQRISL